MTPSQIHASMVNARTAYLVVKHRQGRLNALIAIAIVLGLLVVANGDYQYLTSNL